MKCCANDCPQEVLWWRIVVRNRAIVQADDGFCEQHAKLYWESYLSEDRQGSGAIYEVPGAACFELELIFQNYKGEPCPVLLREVGSKRLAFFPADYSQAGQIYYSLHESPYKERMVHLAIKRLAEQFGGVLTYVMMDQLNAAGYFEAHAMISCKDKMVKLSIRPSDGLALAILAKIPFLVAEDVLKEATAKGDYGKW